MWPLSPGFGMESDRAAIKGMPLADERVLMADSSLGRESMELATRLSWLDPAGRVKVRPMQTRNERRAPDRHLVALRLLKRIALAALVVSAGLWAVPRLLVEAGVLGPDAAEVVQSAANSVSLA